MVRSQPRVEGGTDGAVAGARDDEDLGVCGLQDAALEGRADSGAAVERRYGEVAAQDARGRPQDLVVEFEADRVAGQYADSGAREHQ